MGSRKALSALAAVAGLSAGCPSLSGLTVGADASAAADGSSPVDASSGAGDADATAATAGSSCANSYRAAIMADSPIAMFPLDEPPGQAECANVVAGSTIGCSYSASGLTLGVAGISPCDAAIHFDAMAATVQLDGDLDFAGDVPFTIEAWVKIDAGADGGYPYTDLANASIPPELNGYYILTNEPGVMGLRSEVWRDSTLVMISQLSQAPPLGEFAYIALVHGADHLDHMFLDAVGGGDDQLVLDASNGDRPTTGAPLFWTGFVGSLADVAIYDSALTSAQLSAHYLARSP